MAAPWLNDKPTPNPADLNAEELVETWSEFRNSLVAVMAADEIMRRLSDGRLRVVETIELTDEVTR